VPAFVPPPQPPKGRKLPTFGQIIQQEERKQERDKEKERQAKEKAKKEGRLDVLPAELRLEILKSIIGNTLDESLANVKRYYLAHPPSQKSVETTKAIISYLMEKRLIRSAQELQYAIDELKKLPTMAVLKNPEMISWINSQMVRFYEEICLIIGAGSEDVKLVKEMIAKGINVHAQNEYGDTALLNAIVLGSALIVEMLLKAGANPNIVNEKGNSPTLEAFVGIVFRHGFTPEYKKILTLLLEHGANPNIKLSGHPIIDFINDTLVFPPPLLRLSGEQRTEQRAELLALLRKYGLKE
jgi:hypothetical protein